MDILCSPASTGIDSEGHAANFVETEQLVLYEGTKASFVQASMRASHAITDYLNCGAFVLLYFKTNICFHPHADTGLHALLLESEAKPQIQT